MDKLLKKLRRDYAHLSFVSGTEFCWSPKTREIIYNPGMASNRSASWSLLHEVGHALLDHTHYDSDFDLLNLETAAWQKAQEVGKVYGHEIDTNHIEDCLDTYRDWLHQRSACPTCGNRSFQQDDQHYLCFNCQATWQVSSSRFCRPYRKVTSQDQKKTSSSGKVPKTTFA